MCNMEIHSSNHEDSYTWGSLVGDSWPAYVRILHPAGRLEADGTITPVRWSDIASTGTDLACASWQIVSGIPLHAGRSGPTWDYEPEIGSDSPVVRKTLLRLLLTATTGRVWAAQWDGWGDRTTPAETSELVAGRRYHVVAVTPELAFKLTNDDDPPLKPDLLWDEATTFRALSDIDLPSTIVGCTSKLATHLMDIPDLETVPLKPTAHIVM